jgi:hypothetical protein
MMVPSRIDDVSRATAPSVTHESVGPGPPVTFHREEVLGAEERAEPEPLRGLGHLQLLVVGGTAVRFGHHP